MTDSSAPDPWRPTSPRDVAAAELESLLAGSKEELARILDVGAAVRFIVDRTATLFTTTTTLELAATPVSTPLAVTSLDASSPGSEPLGLESPMAPFVELPLRVRETTRGALRLQEPRSGPLSPHAMNLLSDWARHAALFLDGLLLAAELRTARTDLGEVDFRLQELVARIGHDLRAPLGAVLMWIHVARQAAESDRLDALEAIEAGAREQNSLISELVDLTRARVGRLELERTTLGLAELVDQAVLATAAQARNHDLQVERPLGGGESAMLVGDSVRLVRSIINVVTYAIRVSRAGRRVNLTCIHEPGWARLEVGGPFTTVDLPVLGRVLSAFSLTGFRAERDATSLVFGLCFAREMLALHGGTLTPVIGASDTVTIAIRLPAADA